jgi:four helix bundle protein
VAEDGKIRDYRDLVVWQIARQIVKRIYVLTAKFPREEIYGLSLQMRKAAVSVPSNIAEGYGRGARLDYVRFLRVARGSLYELQTQLLLAQDLGFMAPGEVQAVLVDVDRCSRLLYRLLESLLKKGTETRKGALRTARRRA